ncbi:MAG: amidase, partial [Deltaproteobacteria bacterium]|nr:amidase [Deltaproteobacteria bacterium]
MPTNFSSVLDLTALEQAARIRSGELSSEELTRGYLARIGAHNPKLTAFVQVFAARALRAARKKDAERKAGGTLPPFHGVPICIKDLNLVRGSFTRFGSRAMRYVWSPVDDQTVAQLRRGGFVMVGKTATSELGAMPVTETDLDPPSRNPWNPAHSPGGSSGGTGAAVAAGLVPIGQGNDGAGSIRLPASFCGLYGIKPSRGRVRNPFGFNDKRILYNCGPLARTVDDAAAMLDVMAGLTVGKPHWAPRPPRTFATMARERTGPLRVRFVIHTSIAQTNADVEAAVRRALRTLEQLGHHVEEMAPPSGSIEEFLPLWQKLIGDVPVLNFVKTQPITRWLGEAGRKLRAGEVRALYETLKQRFETWFGDADLVVTPTAPRAAPRVGLAQGKSARDGFFEAA